MLENKKTLFKIYSKSTAIYFHSKYKFEPNITSFHERDAALLTIIQDKNKNFSDLSQKGKNLQHKINICQTAEEQRELCLSVNKLIKEYIERAKNPAGNYKFHPFQSGIDMILTNKNLIKHKDFFNNLFKKHGIDYNI